MKIGDKVRRKQQYLNYNGWKYGDRILTVKSLSASGNLGFFSDCTKWDKDYFDLIEKVETDIIEKLKNAQKCVGRNIKHAGSTYKLKRVYILPKGANSSGSVERYLEDHDYCIVGEFSGYTMPFDDIEFVQSENLKISSDYTAEIYKDKVVVGCQTISIDTVREILKISETLP